MRDRIDLGHFLIGIILTIVLAVLANMIVSFLPSGYISSGVIAMIIGMMIHPLVKQHLTSFSGIDFVAKKLLKFSIILMGATLSLSQVLSVGRISLIVMVFTLASAFGFGNLFGKWFKMDWKLSNLISVGTGVCGGSAIAAVSPTINAKDEDIAYALSATFIFDILMVIIFPLMGRYFGMSGLEFGLWSGTAINDTSSVVAASYAFSEAAGHYAVIVKLTRTLAIIPIVMIFSIVNMRIEAKNQQTSMKNTRKPTISSIFPWFIIYFLVMVVLRSVDVITPNTADSLSVVSKFIMVMSLGAIGLRTNFKAVAKSGFLPMLHGFIISTIVVIVSFVVQVFLGQV